MSVGTQIQDHARQDSRGQSRLASLPGRKLKKRNNRALQNIRINAATRTLGTTYSRFISALKKRNVELDCVSALPSWP